MDEFHTLRVLLATILTAGFNAHSDSPASALSGGAGCFNDAGNVDRGLHQADSLLDECGFVHPDMVKLGNTA